MAGFSAGLEPGDVTLGNKMSVLQLGVFSICNLHHRTVCLLCVSVCVYVSVCLSKLQVLVHDFLFLFFFFGQPTQPKCTWDEFHLEQPLQYALSSAGSSSNWCPYLPMEGELKEVSRVGLWLGCPIWRSTALSCRAKSVPPNHVDVCLQWCVFLGITRPFNQNSAVNKIAETQTGLPFA